MLRRTFGPKRDEEIGEWRRLHNDELNFTPNHIFSGDKVKNNDVGGACSTYVGR
jgi:hypothetical protein